MPRTARKQSRTGIYHVMLRGINRARIFLDDEDNRYFLSVLMKCRDTQEYALYAYCLMGNHVHLLIGVAEEPLERLMKRIGTRFAVWYNAKYYRTGHLFQDRYKSEPVQNEAYFLTALRYILNNPVKAGICLRAEEYPWSSAREYFGNGNLTGITDTGYARDMIGAEALIAYLQEPADDQCMEDKPVRLNDREAMQIIVEKVGAKDQTSCLREISDHPERYVRVLRKEGLSIRQISRLTGLTFAIVRK